MNTDVPDSEIDNICQGLTQNAAKIRHLQRMGLVVRKKPNGRPLVNQKHYDAVTSSRQAQQAGATAASANMNEPRWSVA